MGKKEKKIKRTSLITSIIIYSVIYIAILITGGIVIKNQLQLNKKLATNYKQEFLKDEERTEKLFSIQADYTKAVESLKVLKENRDSIKKELEELKEKEGENVKKIEDLDNQIKAYTPETKLLQKNKDIVKAEFDKVNKKFIELNEKYQESLKRN